MNSSKGFRAKIPANKFYPPGIDASWSLFRQGLVEDILLKNGLNKQAIVVEAQAGQGKTTLIVQFLSRIDMPYAWYQVGQEDSDPILLLNTLMVCIEGVLPEFSSPLVQRIITAGEVSAVNLPKLVNLLLADLNTCLTDDFYIVFDDLHLLQGHEASLSLLNCFFETAPPKIRFILSSREPIVPDGRRLKYRNHNLLRLNNDDLAMNEGEVDELYKKILKAPVSLHTISTIHRATNGWAMGIILLGHHLATHPAEIDLKARISTLTKDKNALSNYFREEIFALLTKDLHRPLLILSLLDEIPVDLAEHLTGNNDIGAELLHLVERNYFVRHLDQTNRLFGFHHLFQFFLRNRATQEFSPEFIKTIFQEAAAYSLEQERPAQALRYYLYAEDFKAMENILAEEGMTFLAQNQTATLAAILEKVPNEILEKLGWFALYAVLANMDSEPQKALPLLGKALTAFSRQQDKTGELLSLVHLISIHITTTGYCKEGVAFLEKAEEIFFEVADSLSVYETIIITRSLAMGFCIFLADIDKASKFSTLALRLANENKIVNFQAALLMVKGYEQIFAGKTASTFMYLEQAAPYIHNPEVGTFNKLAIRMMLFNFMFHNGDFNNYFKQKKQLVAALGNKIVSQSIAGPFFFIWEIDIALNQGRTDDALKLTEQVLTREENDLSPLMLSQALHFKSFILALNQQKNEALQAAEESIKLRNLAGGKYFITLNKIIVGLTHAHCGLYDKGLSLLTEGILEARQLPTEYLEACGSIHRAFVHLQVGNHEEACEDIKTGLRLMRQNLYLHFWAWTPSAMQAVLELAIRQGIEPDYARKLAAERLKMALPDHCRAIPLLNIRTFGGLRLLLNDETVIATEDLTPAQRVFICLLVSSPGLKISKEQVQLVLWPESSQEKAGINFDTMLSRLRKTIAERIKPHSVKNYINLKKGILCLDNCRIDAIEFIQNIEQGLRHDHLQEYWQAGNKFFLAHLLWQGAFVSEVTGEEQIRGFRAQLSDHLLQLTLKWCQILAESDGIQDAIAVAGKALGYEPTNDRLVRLLFNLHRNSPVIQARQVLKQFATALQYEDYPVEEIAELVREITSDSPDNERTQGGHCRP